MWHIPKQPHHVKSPALQLLRNSYVAIWPLTRSVTRGQGGAIPRAPSHYGGAKSLRGAPNGCGRRRKVPTMPQVLSSMQYICFRKTSVSNMGAPNLLLAPGAI